MNTPAHENPSHALASGSTNGSFTDEGRNWYRLGRDYVLALTGATQSFAAHREIEGSHQVELADRDLWPLDTATADEVRDFVAGAHRQVEVELALFRDDLNSSGDGGSRLAPASDNEVPHDVRYNRGTPTQAQPNAGHTPLPTDSTSNGEAPDGSGWESSQTFTAETRAILDRVREALNDTSAAGTCRISHRSDIAFTELGICDFEIRRLAVDLDNEGAAFDALMAASSNISDKIATSADAGNLRMFIAGHQYAHGLSLA